MISILCFAAMLTAFVSCTEDEKDDTQSGKKVFTSFVAGSGSITRTQLTEGNSVEWETGDEISLFDPPLQHITKRTICYIYRYGRRNKFNVLRSVSL